MGEVAKKLTFGLGNFVFIIRDLSWIVVTSAAFLALNKRCKKIREDG